MKKLRTKLRINKIAILNFNMLSKNELTGVSVTAATNDLACTVGCDVTWNCG